MKFRSVFYLVLFVLVSMDALASGSKQTQRDRNAVRSGPGNFYPLLYVLPRETPVKVLEKKGGWVRVKVEGKKALATVEPKARSTSGWLSERCFAKKKARRDFRSLKMISNEKVSKAGVAAAVRGFATRYGKASSSEVSSFFRSHWNILTPEDYLAFQRESRRVLSTSNENFGSDITGGYLQSYEPTMEEEGIGLGIAIRVLGNKMVRDEKKLRYINAIALYLSQFTGAYDIPFRVFLVNQPGYNAGSAPGGFIFVNQDLVGLCQNEAELAGVIAHEMSHIILRHGLKETNERGLKVKLESRFEELETEAGWDESEVGAELSSMALRAYDMLVKPRLQSYEEEADMGAMILLARAGYEPRSVPRVVKAMAQALQKRENSDADMGHGDLDEPFRSLDFKKRTEALFAFAKKTMARIKGATQRERFQRVFR